MRKYCNPNSILIKIISDFQLETKQKNQLILPSQTPMTVVDDALWVDKYRPNSYVDLLSDEPVNRALLHWLHLWDKVTINTIYINC